MLDLLVAGNLLFTLPLIGLAVAVVGVGIRALLSARKHAELPAEARLLFHLGLFAFVFGLLSQGISLYQMMGAIEWAGGVSPAIVAGGLKVSFIAPLMGVVVFVLAMALRLGVDVSRARAIASSRP